MAKSRVGICGCLLLALTAVQPASAMVVYDVDFEAFTVGAPPPFGPGTDRPSSTDPNLITTVETSATVPGASLATGKFARLQEQPGEAPNLFFDSGAAFSSGIVRISLDTLFEVEDRYEILVRNGTGSGLPPASQSIANIDVDGGNMVFRSTGFASAVALALNTTLHIETIFDLDSKTWDAFLNGTQVVNGASFTGTHIGLVGVGFDFTSFDPQPTGFDGVMQFDNFFFEHTDSQVPEPGALALFALGLSGLRLFRRRV